MYTVKDILRIEVAPALGCTEPAAVALCTAAAGSLIPDKAVDSIELWLSPNIYKNAYAVAIPGTNGASGIGLAASLGFFSIYMRRDDSLFISAIGFEDKYFFLPQFGLNFKIQSYNSTSFDLD